MYQSNARMPIPPPPQANPGAFDFLEKFWSNSPTMLPVLQSNVPPVGASQSEHQISHALDM